MVAQSRNTYTVAAYSRLSREDGDRVESDSIINQQRVIEDYCASRGELHIAEHYADAAVIIGLKTLRLKKCQKHAAF